MATELKGKIYEENIADKAIEFQKLFSANRNIYRHLPAAVDGLKPVQRRILYALYADFSDKLHKVQDITGTVTGSYHPHGGSSVESAVGYMANPTTNNIPIILGHGNFGSMNGDRPGAARYIEAKLSKFGYYCYFKDFSKENVDMKPTYNGRKEEPEFLPARYPVVLVNGCFSNIGTGMASNIPPYNFKEVCEATIKLIKNPKAKIYFVPDSPTGCDVVDNKSCKKGFKDGLGKATFIATYVIDYYKNTVKITSVPPSIRLKDVVANISKLKLDGKLPELKDHINNTSLRNGMDYTLYFSNNANIDANMEFLLKSNVGLKKTHPIGIVLIDNYQDKDFNIPSLIINWLGYRREYMRSQLNTKLVSTLEEKHMNDIKLFVFGKDNLSTTVDLAKKAKDRKDFMEKLVKTYGITSLQADTISKMRTCDFNKDAYARYKELDAQLTKEIKDLEKNIDDPSYIDNTIIEQLQEGIKLFGGPRKSRIIDPEQVGKNLEHLIGISEDGYIKKITEGNAIGRISKNSGQRNFINLAMTKDTILLFDSTGKVNRIKVEDIPESKPTAHGIQLSKISKIKGKIVGAIIAPKKADPDLDKYLLVMITSKGNAKKIAVSEFYTSNQELIGMTTNEEDELITVLTAKVDSNKDIILYTNFGDGIRIEMSDIRKYGRSAKGLPTISLRPNEVIVGANKIIPGKDFLFYITSSGKAKLTKLDYFPLMKRKDLPLPLINLEKNEQLVGIASVDKTDSIIVYRKVEDPVTLSMKDIKVTTRAAKPEKIVKTPKGDTVVGFDLV